MPVESNCKAAAAGHASTLKVRRQVAAARVSPLPDNVSMCVVVRATVALTLICGPTTVTPSPAVTVDRRRAACGAKAVDRRRLRRRVIDENIGAT